MLIFVHTVGMLFPPLVRTETIFNTITLWWPPVSGDIQCGQVSYLVTRTPAHGTLTRTSDTFYTITGLNYNTTYNIIVLATSDITGDGDTANITVKTISLQSSWLCIQLNAIHVLYLTTCCYIITHT